MIHVSGFYCLHGLVLYQQSIMNHKLTCITILKEFHFLKRFSFEGFHCIYTGFKRNGRPIALATENNDGRLKIHSKVTHLVTDVCCWFF